MGSVRRHLRRHRGGLRITPGLLGARGVTPEEQQLYEQRTLRKPWLRRLSKSINKPRPGFYVFCFRAFKNGALRTFVRVGATVRASIAQRLIDHYKTFSDWLDTSRDPTLQQTARRAVQRSFRLLFFHTRFTADEDSEQAVHAFAMESCARRLMADPTGSLQRWFQRLARHKDLFYVLKHVDDVPREKRRALRAVKRMCLGLYQRTKDDLKRQDELKEKRREIDQRKREMYWLKRELSLCAS
jgi:hypothetical protein